MNLHIDLLLWAPLIAPSLHIFEEFVWPGGFPTWYRRYRRGAASVNRRFLVIINALLLSCCLQGAMAGRTMVGAGFLLTITAITFANACWHVWASYRSRSYSPGVITGVLLYVPLGFFEYAGWIRSGQVPMNTWLSALVIGGSYHIWSARYHRSHDLVQPPTGRNS